MKKALLLFAISIILPTNIFSQDFVIDGNGSLIQYNGTDAYLQIPNGVRSIADNVFSGKPIMSITMPSSLSAMGFGVFMGCNNLRFVDMSATGIQTLYDKSFAYCATLNTILLPPNLEYIGSSSFLYCSDLQSIDLSPNLKFIDNDAFSYSGLNSIEIPSSINTMGQMVFTNCTKLVNVFINKGIQNIPLSTFIGCSNLQTVDIPNTVTRIDDFAFQGCTSLLSVNLPSSVEVLSKKAFAGCTGLQQITVNWDNPISLSETADVFLEVDRNACVLKVPQGTLAKYKQAEVWKSFLNIQEDIPTGIGSKPNAKTLVYTKNNNIIVANTAGANIAIYDIAGQSVYQKASITSLETVLMKATGVFFIKIDGKFAQKVVIK